MEKAAAEQGKTPLELADRVVARYADLYRRFEVSNDDFIRTTEPRHRAGVEALIARIEAAGDLYVAPHEGWYCVSCEAFYTEKELDDEKRCPVHGTPTSWESEENVFFRLSKYGDALLEHYRRYPEFVRPETRRAEVVSFVRGGLSDLSVSRSKVKWGIPFPGREGVVYVWLDALSNYITALGFGSPDPSLYREFWENEDGRRIHVIGKDILRFHAVYWPAFLLVGRPAAADDRLGTRLVAPRREEDVEVGRQRGPAGSARRAIRPRRASLLSPARDDVWPGCPFLR